MTALTRRLVTCLFAPAFLLGPAAFLTQASFNTLPNQPVRPTYKTFLAAGFTPVTATLNTVYNTGGKHPVTGNMTSRVFKSGHTYAYLYQISIANSVPNTKNLVISYKVTTWGSAFTMFNLSPTVPVHSGAKPVYQMDLLGKGQLNTSGFTFFGSGLKLVDTAQGVDSQFLQANFLPSLSSGLRRGTTSAVLVAFSPLTPKVGNSHITVSGLGTGSADAPAYVPAPEPSSLVLLGLGGAGLVGRRLWHRRRTQPA